MRQSWGHRRAGVDGNRHRRRGRTGIAGHIGRRGGQIVSAVNQSCCRISPGPAAVGRRRAQQRRPVIDLDRAVGFRTAGQRQRVVVGDVVAHHPAVGRE